MDTSRLSRSEYIAVAGAILLVIALFLPWYETNPDNTAANIDGERGTFSGWDVHPIVFWLLLLLAVSPVILAWIIARGYELAWVRGELTAVGAIFGLGLVFFNGIVSKPGEPSGQISLKYGYWLTLFAILLILVGSVMRTGETERRRRPPGTF
ncbi:MAG TPA: hypothetical protein VGP78_01105 [Solirubrobacteraceae bacterium]|nr:hypothetical protein [Solirubrobacteraceae bacterium]